MHIKLIFQLAIVILIEAIPLILSELKITRNFSTKISKEVWYEPACYLLYLLGSFITTYLILAEFSELLYLDY